MNILAKELEETMRIEGEYFVMVKKISPRKSASGKSLLIASTNGRQSFMHDGKEVQVNLNAYTLIPKS